MAPRIAAVKLEDSWRPGKPGVIRCSAQITRVLRKREARLLESMLDAQVSEDRITGYCRPGEVDLWEENVSRALARLAHAPSDGRPTADQRRKAAPTW